MLAAGEVRTKGYVNIDDIVRNTIRKIGYTKAEYRFDADSCAVISAIHEQSHDIAMGVDENKKKDRAGRRRPGHDVRLCQQ